jgi:hypothetical protein
MTRSGLKVHQTRTPKKIAMQPKTRGKTLKELKEIRLKGIRGKKRG